MAADITSPSNERIKWLVRLRDRSHRDEEGVFVVEGERLYRRALDGGLVPTITFISSELDLVTTGQTLTVDPAVMDKASYRQRSQGVIGVFPQISTRLSGIQVPDDPLLLIAEAIGKPGNVGAMLRTAGAAGADALITVDAEIDIHNPNVVRSSTGALFTVPVAVASWDEMQSWLDEREVRVICASPASTVSLWDTSLAGSVALVVGAEDEGLSDRAMSTADQTVHIPQATGTVDSLNVSVAAAILLFEARRQRT